MIHRTATIHAQDLANAMEIDLTELIATEYYEKECAILVMLLIAMGYDHKQVDDLLQEHSGIRNSMRLLDTALYLYRNETKSRQLYNVLIQSHGGGDNNREKDRRTGGEERNRTARAGRGDGMAGKQHQASRLLRAGAAHAQQANRPARTGPAH